METERTKETKPDPHPVDILEEWERAKSNVVVNMIDRQTRLQVTFVTFLGGRFLL